MSGAIRAFDAMAIWLVPALLALIPLWGQIKGVAVFDTFVDGAEEGLRIALKIFPFMIGIMVALAVFRASGAMDMLSRILSPVTDRLGFPHAVLPLMLIRPLSGAGSLAATVDLLKIHGPDSFVGRLASIMQGSTDTTFYVITVYFGSVGVRRTRYAAGVGLIADFAGFIAALVACRWFFGGH